MKAWGADAPATSKFATEVADGDLILDIGPASASKYAGEAYLRHMMLAAVESHPDIPAVVHQDHGTSAAVCQQSIRSGFTSVMMDGSLLSDGKTPASYEYISHAWCAKCRTQLASRSKVNWVVWAA